MSVRLPVSPSVQMEQLGSHWTDFHQTGYLSIFGRSVEKIQDSLKSDKSNGYFTRRPINFLSYLAQFFLESEIFQTKFVEKIKTHFMFSNFFPKPFRLWDNAEIYKRAWQV